MEQEIKLTQYASGSGCGCKIAPKVLDEILQQNAFLPTDKNLLVGYSTKDDAAVYDLGNGQALISTTDFFMPVVNDAIEFGRIAAANALSDVYAMGGKPLFALAILGWPVEKLSSDIASKVLQGAREVCKEAGIVIAGGHSISSPEPFFGLAVNGISSIKNLKTNSGAKEGDLIFLTKPIGVGILTSAEKREQLLPLHKHVAANQMMQLNEVGETLGKFECVTAMTDITGFGLAGHLIEIAEASNVSARLYWNKIPFIEGLDAYIQKRIYPDAVYRNWQAYGNKIKVEKPVSLNDAFVLLSDPQTNGGLLFTANTFSIDEIQKCLLEYQLNDFIEPIGIIMSKEEKILNVV